MHCVTGCARVCQTITGAMTSINPPEQLESEANRAALEYMQEVASQPDFDYPQVRVLVRVPSP